MCSLGYGKITVPMHGTTSKRNAILSRTPRYPFLLEGEKGASQPPNDQGPSKYLTFIDSDTVSITMTGILFYLMCHPEYQVKLLQEFISAEKDHGILNTTQLASLPLLNGIINETLRLHYPGPSGFPRITPPEGLRIGDTFIPGGINVKVPIYTVYRNGRNFAQPGTFIPERWTTKKELVRQPQAFAPFLIGPYNCVGKQLALLQIRLVTYKIISMFEVLPLSQKQLAEYWDQRADGFNLGLGPLRTIFKHRTAPSEGDRSPLS
jgi:cytochrome P450